MNALTGTWTYRSFINNPDPVNTPDQALSLIFGEGELVITCADPAPRLRAPRGRDGRNHHTEARR